MKICYKKCLVFVTIALLSGGCSLLPKPVELGAKKVKPVPEFSIRDTEVLKQTAALAARTAGQTVLAATLEGSSETVLVPARETAGLTRSVSFSLGSPEAQWKATADVLAARLDSITGRLNRQVEEYRRKIEPLVGKKIEGSGWLQVPYFLWIGGIFVLGLLVWTGLKVVGVAYPPVGIVSSALGGVGRVSGSVISKAYAQVVKGGEEFKTALDRSGIEAAVVTRVKDLFRSSQMGAQDQNNQAMVDKLTMKG